MNSLHSPNVTILTPQSQLQFDTNHNDLEEMTLYWVV